MLDDPSQNPWLSQFYPPRIAATRTPAETADFLLRLTASAQPSSNQAPSPERSVIEKIGDATRRVRKIIQDNKLNKPVQVEWISRIIGLLSPFYGKQSPLLLMLQQVRKDAAKTQLPADEFTKLVEQVEHFTASFGLPSSSGSFVVTSRPSLIPATRNVFIIHGRDETNQLRLSKIVREDFKLTPVVLLDKPGRSAPTIDKFELYAQTCSYAIALFTADDTVIAKSGEEYLQARPNVIYETAWFVSRLGRERVLILLQDGVKIHSDFDGVNRIPFRDDVEDGFRRIRGELEAAALI